MTITLNLPEDIVKELTAQGEDISRTALESLALEEYRMGRLSEEQIRRMLGLATRFDVHAFLKQHKTHLNYTEADLDQDLAMARALTEE
jgi:predicted HTH domain antitoxin